LQLRFSENYKSGGCEPCSTWHDCLQSSRNRVGRRPEAGLVPPYDSTDTLDPRAELEMTR
jgi:hypothetical protein